MVKVKVKSEFLDRTDNLKQRKVGDVYEADPDRAKYLSILGFVDLVEDKQKTIKSK